MATLTLTHVSKAYRKDIYAVRDVSLEVADGEFVSLVGPSGCGKSTTLNLIAGLETPTHGTIAIDGTVVNARSPKERDIAMVFQSYALYPHLNVRRNLAFPLEVAGLSRAQIDARVHETAELLGLTELLSRRPAELSGGQRQRVALGRALVRRPKLFLFDEPLSNLDAALRTQMRAELKKLHEQLRATFVYVTHDQTEAMTLSERVVVMRGGEVQQVDSPHALYHRPQNRFVAEFFGAPRINIVSPARLGIHATRPDVVVGVRPEHLTLHTEGARGIAASVYLVEPVGAETWVTVELDGERLTVRVPGDFRASSGTRVGLELTEGALHFFDAQTGARVSS